MVNSEAEITGEIAQQLRRASGQNQVTFWRAVGVNQSSGCRYEQGNPPIPAPVRLLIKAVHLAGIDLAASVSELEKVAQAQRAARTIAAENRTVSTNAA